jgi:hypothetical protein|tara:strand:+ start:207 stop:410 length:204 start_codon:yes stop_codon:yes gene_type:complete
MPATAAQATSSVKKPVKVRVQLSVLRFECIIYPAIIIMGCGAKCTAVLHMIQRIPKVAALEIPILFA